MSLPKQRLVLLGVLAVAIGFALRDGLRSTVTVTAQDGTEVVVRVDTEAMAAESAPRGAVPDGEMRRYGVSEKASGDLPTGRGNEANLAGTKAR